jgi:hypothetical protein
VRPIHRHGKELSPARLGFLFPIEQAGAGEQVGRLRPVAGHAIAEANLANCYLKTY